MKMVLISFGNYIDEHHRALCDQFIKRLQHLTSFDVEIIDPKKKYKSNNVNQKKKVEATLLMSKLQSGDHLVLLDEKGTSFTSKSFAEKINQWQYSGFKRLVFVIGGAYGFDVEVYEKAAQTLSLSKMTLNHQLARLFFLEQLYRGLSILHGLPYHNE